ncbi:Secreted protein [Cupriavidus necator]|uniref:Uncharacterized protein n=1 Tax=Cupriavidus necator (strain ATCC 17699 / DSM 428 / KCTC 22496 / NCIMB 10442 / H16 / Stanier 337) TaxID=381666 RepID=A0AAE5ZFD8_CUPNH|nr:MULTISPECIES: hypothetical protein [Cupriavidus]QCC02128.1 hypothetical protein E6A55_16820 [Cupriavidus necator H16]QQB78466.1 hypothetical protein I6H87_09335 [Cupriavidus necator]WKA40532.1 hypothetical protein QWP09_16845 [Cupriavidus necator]
MRRAAGHAAALRFGAVWGAVAHHKATKLPAGHFKHELFQQCACRGNAGKPTRAGILHCANLASAQEIAAFWRFAERHRMIGVSNANAPNVQGSQAS